MVNTLTYCICSKKCQRRTNRTNKTQLFLDANFTDALRGGGGNISADKLKSLTDSIL